MKAYLVSVSSAEHTLELAAALLDEGVLPEDLSVVVDESYAEVAAAEESNGRSHRVESDLVSDRTKDDDDLNYASTGEIEMDRSYEAVNNRRGVIYESEIGGGISTASPDDTVSSIEEMDDASEAAESTLEPLGDFDERDGPPQRYGPDPEDVPEDSSSEAGGAIHGEDGGIGVGVLAALIPAVVPGVGVVMGDGQLASDLLAEEDRAIEEGVAPFLKSQGLEDGEAARFEAALAAGGGILEVTAASGEASGRQVRSVIESLNGSRYKVVDVL